MNIIVKPASILCTFLFVFAFALTGKGQSGKIFPDSLGSRWIYTLRGMMAGQTDTCNGGGPGECFWLERDTIIQSKRYIAMATQRRSFQGTGDLYCWVRPDNINRILYVLDSHFHEQLVFDFNLSIGDSTPILFSPATKFTIDPPAFYKGKITAKYLDSSNGRKFIHWVVSARDIATGMFNDFDIGEGIGGIYSYSPLTFQFDPRFGGQRLTCFNGLNYGRSAIQIFYCGCPSIAPPVVTRLKVIREWTPYSIVQMSFSSPIRLQTSLNHISAKFTVHDSNGRVIERGEFAGSSLEVFRDSTPSHGIYFLTMHSQNVRPVNHRIMVLP